MTTEESFAALEAVKNEKNPYDFAPGEWRSLSKEQKLARYDQQDEWKAQHNKRWLEAVHNLVPNVGLPCTIVYYSDYRAATVTRIISPTKVEVMHNETICKDWYKGEYEILPELCSAMGVDVFTKRRNGQWVQEGQKSKDGVKLVLQYQRHYIDPSY